MPTKKTICTIHNTRWTVMLDTNVIYPIIIRDMLFWMAYFDVYIPKWSEHIFDEWLRVMLMKGVDRKEAHKRIRIANKAFPEALVKNYKYLIQSIELPDPNDAHVLAAVIKAQAHTIVTNNKKDFPNKYVSTFNISVTSADEFISALFQQQSDTCLMAFKEMVKHKKKPKYNEWDVLKQMNQAGLHHTFSLINERLKK